jgi:hypothetical protein
VFPSAKMEAPLNGHIVSADAPIGEIQNRDRVLWPQEEGKRDLSWQPSEASVQARREAQRFVQSFMQKDYIGALNASLEAPIMRQVELNPPRFAHQVNFTARDLSSNEAFQGQLNRLSQHGVFNWKQIGVDAELRVNEKSVIIPKAIVELNGGKTKAPLVDFVKDGKTYKVAVTNKDTKGGALSAADIQEADAIRQSEKGQRMLAEMAVIAFEESIVHANQHLGSSGEILAPTFAEYARDFTIAHDNRTKLQRKAFLGVLGRNDEGRVNVYEQEVPVLLYDAGMPLSVIEHHYFFGNRHVADRTPVIDYLREREALKDTTRGPNDTLH